MWNLNLIYWPRRLAPMQMITTCYYMHLFVKGASPFHHVYIKHAKATSWK